MFGSKTIERIYGIVGAGGHGREVMPLAIRQLASDKRAEVAFVVEDEYLGENRSVNGHKLMGLSEFLKSGHYQHFYNVAIGSGVARARLAQKLEARYTKPFTIKASSFEEGENNAIGEGASFSNFSVVSSNVKIGKHFQCNVFCQVSHDCVIGDFVTFAPGVRCNGGVIIEDYVTVGAGAIIRDSTKSRIVIGKGAVIGMGAVVTKSVPAGAVVVGNPAKALTTAP